MTILEASGSLSVPSEETDVSGIPGAVTLSNGRMLIETGDGGLEVTRLQLEGRGAVTAAEFLRGYPAIVGARLPD